MNTLAEPHQTLPQSLAASGIACAAFLNNVQLDPATGLHRGFHFYEPECGAADVALSKWESWMKAHSEGKTFSYLHFMESHWPYKPRRRHVSLFGGDRDASAFDQYSARDFGRLRKSLHRGTATVSEIELVDMTRMYDASIRRLDGKIKNLIQSLSDLSIDSRTTLIITSDHGEEFMEHGAIGHGHTLYREVTHVPLVLFGPDIAKSLVRSEPVSLVDLPATIASLAGIRHGCGKDLFAGAESGFSPVFAELTAGTRTAQMLYQPPWRCYREEQSTAFTPRTPNSAAQTETDQVAESIVRSLYNVQEDPLETTDLGTHSVLDENASSSFEDLERLRSLLGGTDHTSDSSTELDAAMMERIRALGYID